MNNEQITIPAGSAVPNEQLDKIHKLKQKIEEQRGQIQNACEIGQTLLDEKNKLKDNYEKLSAEFLILSDHHNSVKFELERKSSLLISLGISDNVSPSTGSATPEFHPLRQSTSQQSLQFKKNRLKELELENQELKTDKANLEFQLAKNQSQLEQLRKIAKENDHSNDCYTKQLEDQLENLTSELLSCQSKNDQLCEEILISQTENENMLQEVRSVNADYNSLKGRYLEAVKEIDSLQENYQEAADELQSANNEMRNLKLEMENLNNLNSSSLNATIISPEKDLLNCQSTPYRNYKNHGKISTDSDSFELVASTESTEIPKLDFDQLSNVDHGENIHSFSIMESYKGAEISQRCFYEAQASMKTQSSIGRSLTDTEGLSMIETGTQTSIGGVGLPGTLDLQKALEKLESKQLAFEQSKNSNPTNITEVEITERIERRRRDLLTVKTSSASSKNLKPVSSAIRLIKEVAGSDMLGEWQHKANKVLLSGLETISLRENHDSGDSNTIFRIGPSSSSGKTETMRKSSSETSLDLLVPNSTPFQSTEDLTFAKIAATESISRPALLELARAENQTRLRTQTPANSPGLTDNQAYTFKQLMALNVKKFGVMPNLARINLK